MKIIIVGLGLIGGSLARAIAKTKKHSVFGIDKDKFVIKSAREQKIISEKDADLKNADMIIICLYPEDTVNFINQNTENISKNTIVIDTCGIKKYVCDKLFITAKKHGFTFIGSHPMAGCEQSGFANSCDNLFNKASFIITPGLAKKSDIDKVRNFAFSIGFQNVIETTPENHDSIIAFTSQLPHVIASAYINDPRAFDHIGYSAGSYKDVSRVATINANMWTELFIGNKDEIVSHIDILTKNLLSIKCAIKDENRDLLFTLLKTGDKIKREIG